MSETAVPFSRLTTAERRKKLQEMREKTETHIKHIETMDKFMEGISFWGVEVHRQTKEAAASKNPLPLNRVDSP